jgi:hypothetical protein
MRGEMDLVQLNADISREFPSFKVVRKSDSFLMKVLNVFLRIITLNQMTEYMTDFTTTIGTTVYVPTAWEKYIPRTQIAILRHERIHMRQAARMGRVVFFLTYVFWYLPLFLSWGRAKLEMEAYEETMRAARENGVDITRATFREDIIKHFTTGQYGWMWIRRRDVERWYDETSLKIISGS